MKVELNWVNLIITILSLLSIGIGVWLIKPAFAFIVVGALLWIDLTIEGLKK